MDWFNDLLETGGELIGGAVDAVGEIANDAIGDAGDLVSSVLDNKLQQEANRAVSSDPSAHRALINQYQQPNGDVVYPSKTQPNYVLYASIGGGFLILAGAVYLAMRKGG